MKNISGLCFKYAVLLSLLFILIFARQGNAAYHDHDNDSFCGAVYSFCGKALAFVADSYSIGRFVRQSDEKAMKYYLMAAELKNTWAMLSLGAMYGLGTRANSYDFKEAMNWFRKAAILGDCRGMASIGDIYKMNNGAISQDYQLAMAWFKHAADCGDASAMANIAHNVLQRPWD